MWFFKRLAQMLSAGTASPVDPERLRELVTVPLFEAPLLKVLLEDADIDYVAVEQVNIASRVLSDIRLLVKEKDYTKAQNLLEQRL